jgi:hypothetical protein
MSLGVSGSPVPPVVGSSRSDPALSRYSSLWEDEIFQTIIQMKQPFGRSLSHCLSRVLLARDVSC